MALNRNIFSVPNNERSIDSFKSRLVSGGARPNLFEVEMDFPSGVGIFDEEIDNTTHRMLIKGAQLPASNIQEVIVPFRGRQLKVAGDRRFDPWTITVINDTDFLIRDAMEKWSNSINDIQTAQGTINPEDYQTSARVFQKSREGVGPGDTERDLRIYKFEGIYPNVVSSIPLDFGATDQIEEFQVTFNYLFYEVQTAGGLTLND